MWICNHTYTQLWRFVVFRTPGKIERMKKWENWRVKLWSSNRRANENFRMAIGGSRLMSKQSVIASLKYEKKRLKYKKIFVYFSNRSTRFHLVRATVFKDYLIPISSSYKLISYSNILLTLLPPSPPAKFLESSVQIIEDVLCPIWRFVLSTKILLIFSIDTFSKTMAIEGNDNNFKYDVGLHRKLNNNIIEMLTQLYRCFSGRVRGNTSLYRNNNE